jgi:arylsulfatase A-like enzyme
MTGRNHNRVGAGQIAEFANDWDGYSGVIPKSSATVAEVLRDYGYATSAYGKDHNTPVEQIANGPYDRTPTGRGFDYFYGFIAGETSQWEPTLWENTTPVSPPHVENYEDFHLTEAMADKSPRNGPTSTRASSTTAGTPTRSGSSSVRRRWAGSPPTPFGRRVRRACPRGRISPTTRSPSRHA